jgi:DNA-binding CsgD family transcriptional regulator
MGEWGQAEAHLPVTQPWTGEQTRMRLALDRAALAAGRGQLAAADQLLAELEPMAANSAEPLYISWLAIVVADVRSRAGDVEAARAAVDGALDRIESASGDTLRAAAVAAAGVSAEADAAERARDVGDAAAAALALERIERLLARVAAAAGPSRPVEQAALAGARAEALRAKGDPDPAAYARAAAAWDAVGRPEPAARMRWRETNALAEAGDREAASAAARAAHAAASRIGAGWLRGEIEALAARARLELGAVDEPDQPEEDAFGLTARERQVLALLADGATNREIGTSLFMAEKTASVHVSRILTKLNARTRTEAAAVAHRHQLLDEDGSPSS